MVIVVVIVTLPLTVVMEIVDVRDIQLQLVVVTVIVAVMDIPIVLAEAMVIVDVKDIHTLLVVVTETAVVKDILTLLVVVTLILKQPVQEKIIHGTILLLFLLIQLMFAGLTVQSIVYRVVQVMRCKLVTVLRQMVHYEKYVDVEK
jgi:hypothetical protein